MSALDRIAFYQSRRDEVPNQKLANDLASSGDKVGIQEIAENLHNKNNNIRSDCLKVLYEIGYKRPELIVPYTNDFIELLGDKNNRMVWGAMIALATVAEFNPRPIVSRVDEVLRTIDAGKLITLVWGIRAIARAAAKSATQKKAIALRLVGYLKSCNARDVPTHLESMLPVIDKANWTSAAKIVELRKKEMTASHLSRLKKVLREIPWART